MLRVIFSPIIAIMNQLTYVKKFILIILLGGSLVSLTNFFLLTEINSNINTAQNQSIGAYYNNQVKEILKYTQQHRGLSGSFLTGNQAAQADMLAARTQLERLYAEINDWRQPQQAIIQDEQLWQKINSDWQQLVDDVPSLTASQSFTQHTQLIKIILELIKAVGDNTGLVLDTDLDRLYLINGSLRELPMLTENLGQLRAIGSGIANRTEISDAEINTVNNILIAVRLDIEKLTVDIATAISANPELKNTVGILLTEALTEIEGYLNVINNELLQANLITLDSSTYFEVATTAINASFTIYEYISKYIEEAFTDNLAEQKQKRSTLVVATIIVSLLVMYAFIGFYLAVIKSIKTLNQASTALAAGDLTVRADMETRDELLQIGKSFNIMADSLAKLIKENKEVALQVANSSSELSENSEQTMKATNEVTLAIQEVAEGAETQVASANESARAMEEIAQGVTRVAESASTIAEAAGDMSNKANQGNNSLQETVLQMQNIQTGTQKTVESVITLQNDAQEIGGILQIITDISSQTNLLALNAAIEAARAGDAGKGFAVVAEEIRKLADQTGKATGQINSLIDKIQLNVNTSAKSMDVNRQQVDKGIDNIRSINEIFQDIINSVHNVTRQIEDLSSVSEEMAAGAQQISASMQELADIARNSSEQSQTIAASSEEQLAIMQEVARSASGLEQLAKRLQDLVSTFKV